MSNGDERYIVAPNATKKVQRLIHDGELVKGRTSSASPTDPLFFLATIFPGCIIPISTATGFWWLMIGYLPIQIVAFYFWICGGARVRRVRRRRLQKGLAQEKVLAIGHELWSDYEKLCAERNLSPGWRDLSQNFSVIRLQIAPAYRQKNQAKVANDNSTRSHLERYITQELGKIADGQRAELLEQERVRELEAQALRREQDERRRAAEDAASLRLTETRALFPLDGE